MDFNKLSKEEQREVLKSIELEHLKNELLREKGYIRDPNELFRATDQASRASERLYSNYLEYTKEATIEASKTNDSLSDDEFANLSSTLSRFFENLEVIYHWSEHPIELPNESVLKGEQAYLFLKELAKADKELNSAREQGEYDYYDKTKLSIKISDPDTSLSLNGVRFDLGDNDLGKYDSIASALKAYREENISFLKSLSFTEVNKLFSSPTSEINSSSAQFKSQDELNQVLDKQLQLGNKTLDRFYEQERNYEQAKEKMLAYIKDDDQPEIELTNQNEKVRIDELYLEVSNEIPSEISDALEVQSFNTSYNHVSDLMLDVVDNMISSTASENRQKVTDAMLENYLKSQGEINISSIEQLNQIKDDSYYLNVKNHVFDAKEQIVDYLVCKTLLEEGVFEIKREQFTEICSKIQNTDEIEECKSIIESYVNESLQVNEEKHTLDNALLYVRTNKDSLDIPGALYSPFSDAYTIPKDQVNQIEGNFYAFQSLEDLSKNESFFYGNADDFAKQANQPSNNQTKSNSR